MSDQEPMDIDPKHFFERLFDAAVAAADPRGTIGAVLPKPPRGRTVVVGCGKGVVELAAAFEAAWEGGDYEGAVVTRYGYGRGVELQRIEVLEAAHPVPDEAGLAASERLLDLVSGLSEDDLVIALICGGGSALLPAPPEGLTLEDEIAVNRALLASGAPISIMNTVRKHLSRIKGGRLAAAAGPAPVVTIAISDIPGDNPAFIASGPTVPDPRGRGDALAAIEAYGIQLPQAAMDHLRSEAARAPDPAAPAFAGHSVHVIASAARSLDAAEKAVREMGIDAVILSDNVEGEAREIAKMHAAMARQIAATDRPFQRPVAMLSGGETSVSLRGSGGKGGRNTEFLLSLAIEIEGWETIHAFAADTDGIDGSEDNAGAFCHGASAARMRQSGHDPRSLLAANDAWTAFDAIGDLFVPGPTGTNVNDLRVVLIV